MKELFLNNKKADKIVRCESIISNPNLIDDDYEQNADNEVA